MAEAVGWVDEATSKLFEPQVTLTHAQADPFPTHLLIAAGLPPRLLRLKQPVPPPPLCPPPLQDVGLSTC